MAEIREATGHCLAAEIACDINTDPKRKRGKPWKQLPRLGFAPSVSLGRERYNIRRHLDQGALVRRFLGGQLSKAIGGRRVDRQPPNAGRPTAGGVDFHNRPVEADIIAGDLEMGRPKSPRSLENPVYPAAQNTLMGARHAHVALKRGTPGQDLIVGGGYMGMGPKDGRYPSV